MRVAKLEKASEKVSEKKPEKSQGKEIENTLIEDKGSITEIIKLIDNAKILTVATTAKGPVFDESTLAAKCAKLHIHKYFLSDIVRLEGRVACKTCSMTNKFAKFVLQVAENMLNVPFVLVEKRFDTTVSSIELANFLIKVVLVCNKSINITSETKSEVRSFLLIKLNPSTSVKKIQKAIRAELLDYPKLTSEQNEKLRNLFEIRRPSRKAFEKDRIPFTEPLANMNAIATKVTKLTAKLNLNVTDDPKLYFENC